MKHVLTSFLFKSLTQPYVEVEHLSIYGQALPSAVVGILLFEFDPNSGGWMSACLPGVLIGQNWLQD